MQNKVVILNNNKDKNFKAILTLSSVGKSNIKFFNLASKYKSLALGFRQSDKVLKVPLNMDGNSADFSLSELDENRSFTCAVVDVTTAFSPEIILSASENGSGENEHIENAFSSLGTLEASEMYQSDSEEEIEKLIDENIQHDNSTTYFDACAKCKYRQAFYDGCDGCSSSDDDISEDVQTLQSDEQLDAVKTEKLLNLSDNFKPNNDETDENATFYEQIKPQIDALFEKYDRDDRLESILPDSSWVRVTYDDVGGFYVLGIIRENGEVKYISYGMPSADDSVPPDDLSTLAQYLKLGEKEGYWIVCQDAQTGKTMKVKIIE